ncbi:hypothetical protein HYDPIDRAFT_109368 [Hydnomerulius pinastri MD-312]|nr:hypothetical protein HYDPIDRAFT_109368 [Hydnomerulius pinastri MD-312]
MGAIAFVRIAVLGLSTLFSIIALGLSAHLISLTETYFDLYFVFSALGVAAGVLSFLTLPVMLFVDFVRHGAFTSMIVVELVWLFILWVLWIATAGEAVTAFNFYFPYGCVYNNLPTTNQACHEIQAVEAFAFLNFILLMVYNIFLLVVAIIAANNGNGVWLSSVKESTFFAPSNPPVQQHQMGQYNSTPAPQPQAVPQQYTGTPGTPVHPQYTGSPVPSQQPYPGTPGQHSQAIPV